MKRREFLDLSAKSLSLLMLSELGFLQRALAAGEERLPQFFVQITLQGGWDVTLGIDPWLKARPVEKEMFIEYDPSNIFRAGQIAFGPSMMPMKDYASYMNVINGAFLSEVDNGHQAAESYILSGSVSQNWGSLPVEISECRGEGFFGILTQGSLGTGLRSPKITTLDSVGTVLTGNSPLVFNSSSDANNRLSNIRGEFDRAQDKFTLMKAIAENFRKTSPQLTSAHYMAAAMAAGLSSSGFYSPLSQGNLDTHSEHPEVHQRLQMSLWEDVKNLLDIYRTTPLGNSGQSLFDRTTFFITSEFARTAALNSSKGKDHNPFTNSVLLISPNMKGNISIGGSRLVDSKNSKTGESYHIAAPIDWTTGRALESRENARIIKPENIAATVIESMGISRRRFGSVSPSTQSLYHLLKKS